MISCSQLIHGSRQSSRDYSAHYLLIRGMTCFDCQDGFPMLSALVCMVINWTGPTLNHDIRLSNCHVSPIYYVA